MFYVLQNESDGNLRRVPILLTDAATGTTAQTGIASTNIFPSVNINGGVFAGGAGTVGEAGFGQYYYQMDSTEIGSLGLAGIHITAVGCRDYDAIAQIAAFNVYSAAGLGISAGDVWNYDISGVSSAGTAGSQLNLAALGTAGGGISAYDVWSFDYVNAPGGVVPISAAERLEETRTNTYTIDSNTSNIADSVWNRDPINTGDNITGDFYSAYLYQLGTGTTGYAGISITAGDVWEYDISAISTAGTAGSQLNLAASPSGAGISAGDVWNYATRSITGGIADTVTTLTNRSGFAITGGTITTVSDKTGYSLSGTQTFNLTGDITGNLSGSVNSVTGAVGSVTGNIGGNVVGSVGSVVGNITGNLSGSVGSVTADVNVSTASMTGIAGTVWSYATRTITGGIADTVTTLTNGVTVTTNNDKTGYSLSGTQSFNLTGNITGNVSGSVGSVSGNVTGSVGSVVGSVGSVTADVSVTTASMTGIAGTVWSFATRTITGGTITTVSDKTGYSLSGTQSFNLTGNITGSVSGSVGSVTGSVGSVVSAVSLSTATQASIANSVWLTDVTSYVAPSAGEDLATAAVGGISPADVWTYATRTITGGIADTVTTLTNRAGFAITGGTIDVVNDKTGYSLSGSQTFNVTGNITGNVTGSVGSVSGAVGSVAGNVAGNVVGSVASVTNPVSVATASMTGIAGTVWSYGTRTLTSGGGITAGDVWTYNISGITNSGTAGNQLNDAAVSGSVVTIVNGPYTLNSTAEGTDGRIDILQDSVQTIELMLVNAFGSPINIAGNYTVSVDIYDEASALVHSYTPTINYALGGILSFDLDTLVTAVIGRYSVVVSLTDGDVIQVGPIQILVRPL
jgi:hypothetical protein